MESVIVLKFQIFQYYFYLLNMSVSPESNKKLLSTSSPEGIQVASKITPTRLADLLIKKGPLPIRHITYQLTLQVPSFDLLSLSKQRRLIMSAMSQVDPVNNVVFEKIGWGQWAIRKLDSNFIITEGTEGGAEVTEAANKIDINELKQTNLKLGWAKKKQVKRESISSKLIDIKLPVDQYNENVITSDSEFSDDDDEDLDLDEGRDLPPVKFANRVPENNTNTIRLSFNRSRLNSFEESNHSNTSINSIPSSSPNYTSQTPRGRRKSSFNESHVRTKLTSNNIILPPISNPQNQPLPHLKIYNDDTDEEDWATIGPESLRAKGITKKKITPRKFNSSRSNSMSNHRKSLILENDINDEERSAALALVGLMN